MNNIKVIILFLIGIISQKVSAQTLIMNEVSNGATGNQEYVEFVVVSNTVTYNCSSPTPPCIDIRNWIFDDNSGYHGGSGVAPGAVRFSNNPIWACVPLGTIILIYNDGDRNIAIPPDDTSMIDGNCTIIAPMNCNLFESNATTPGAVACSYPAVGWTLGGNWNNTVFANVGDCARIVDLGGCEVFSVCWGSDNFFNLIYFPATAAQRVYYFNDVNPQLQANWTNGSASPSPGSQTPGVPNNPLNAAYIAQFNNGCLPITSISVTATSISAGCTCNGSATANASGSIGGYTYLWSNGQTTATASSLCAGIYTVTATSHIGCVTTTTVLITSTSSTSVSVNSQTICAGAASVLTASPTLLGGTYLWLPGGQTTQTISVSPSSTTTYSVSYTLSGCSTFTTVTVFVNPSPILTVNSSTICAGQSATLTSTGATTYNWNTGTTLNALTVSPLSTTNYTVTGTSAGCTTSLVATVYVNPMPIVTVNSSTICLGQSATLTATGATTYSWNTGSTLNPLTVSPILTTNYTVTGTTGGCTNTAVSTVSVSPNLTLIVNSPTICLGQTATLTVSGASSYIWSNGTIGASLFSSPISNSSFTVNGISGICTGSTIATISVIPIPLVTVNSSSICAGQSATLTSIGATTYSWNTGSTSNPLIVSPIATSNYTVTGITSGCASTTVASVFVSPSPIVTVTSTSICAGQTATLTATGATTYSWNTGSILNTLVVSPLSTTNYSVTGTAAGCPNTAIAIVSVNPLPIVTVNSTNICIGQSSILTALGATTYSWNTGSTLNLLTVSPLTTTNYTVIGITGSCTNTAVSNVSVNPLPIITVSSATICEGQTATLTSLGASTYSWNTGSVSNVLSVSPLVTTNYSVTGTTISGCSASAVGAVIVIPYPVLTALSSQPIICSGAISNLSAYGAINYTWSAGGALTSTVSVSPSVTSIYTVTGSNGTAPVICSNTQTVLVTVIPQTTVIVSATHSICVGESENVYAQGGDTYNWLPTTGVSSPTAFTTFIQPTVTTIYTVTASHSGLCPGTATLQIIVHPLPIVYAGADTTINIDETYVLHGIGNVPVGFLSPNSNPLICNYCATVEVNPKETTCFTLKGESEFGCVAYDEVCINVTKDWNVYIPNAFSPNGDSDNDVFIPVGYGLSDIKLYIFDRWGELIFISNNRIIGWDGTLKDNKCEQGVYVYKVEIKTITGIKLFRTGHVTLLSSIK